jgi:cytochrome c oxidase subunit II
VGSLDPAGPFARTIADLWWLLLILGTAVYLVFAYFLGLGIFRARDRSPEPTSPDATHPWILRYGVVMTVLVLVVVLVATLIAMREVPTEAPRGALDVEVVGHQFWWEVRYPDAGIRLRNEMRIPVGRPIRVTLWSADVIHSFWVPRLAGKQDLVPGQTENLLLTAPEPGTYRGTCAEYCGLSHANMRFRVIADEPSDFDAWVQDQTGEAAAVPPPEIEQLVTGTCMSCHQIRGLQAVAQPSQPAPDLTHIGSRQTIAAGLLRNDAHDLARWLRNPPGVKPGSLMPNYHLTDDQVDALVEFLETLE